MKHTRNEPGGKPDAGEELVWELNEEWGVRPLKPGFLRQEGLVA